MASTEDRRTWFGLGGRPRLPYYLRVSGVGPRKMRRVKPVVPTRVRRGKRLKGLDEFEKPAFVGRMARIAWRQKLEWWGLMAAGVGIGGAIGWFLI